MPTTLTGSPGAYVNTTTTPSDTEPANATSLNFFAQRLLDNEKSLFDQMNAGGVLAVRVVTNVAALKALTGMTNGQCAVVLGDGLYVYVDPNATAEALPWIVTPTAGTGRWFNELYLVKGAASGLATLDPDGKLSLAQTRGQYITTYYTAGYNSGAVSISNSEGDVGPTLSIPGVAVGDILRVAITMGGHGTQTGGAAGSAYCRAVVVGPSTTTYSGPQQFFPSGVNGAHDLATSSGNNPAIAVFTATEAGTYTAKLRGGSTNAFATYTISNNGCWVAAVDQFRNV